MVTGLLFTLLAIVANGVASVVESVGTHRAQQAKRPVVRNPVYLCGLAIDLLGFLAALIAMRFLPLFLVQSAVACSVGVTALIAVRLGLPLTTRSRIALTVMILGLGGLAFSAAPGGVTVLDDAWNWALLALAVPIAGLGVAARRLPRRAGAIVLAFDAGLAFTVVAISARTLELPDSPLDWLTSPSLLAIVANGIAGTIAFAEGLERGSVTMIAAINYATETLLPSIVGLTLLDDHIRLGLEPLTLVGFVLAIGSALALARFSTIGPAGRSSPAPAPA